MNCLIVMIYWNLTLGGMRNWGIRGAGLLGKAVLVARGVGTGFDQGLKKVSSGET